MLTDERIKQLADEHNKPYNTRKFARAIEAEVRKEQAEKIAELEHLCDATYVAQGADAYTHACARMEQFQKERAKAGKEIGTEGSLCDGMEWLYGKLGELERQLVESVELLRSLRHYSNCSIDSSFRPHFDDLLIAVNKAINAKETKNG